MHAHVCQSITYQFFLHQWEVGAGLQVLQEMAEEGVELQAFLEGVGEEVEHQACLEGVEEGAELQVHLVVVVEGEEEVGLHQEEARAERELRCVG